MYITRKIFKVAVVFSAFSPHEVQSGGLDVSDAAHAELSHVVAGAQKCVTATSCLRARLEYILQEDFHCTEKTTA
jgi:hypothetical protein